MSLILLENSCAPCTPKEKGSSVTYSANRSGEPIEIIDNIKLFNIKNHYVDASILKELLNKRLSLHAISKKMKRSRNYIRNLLKTHNLKAIYLNSKINVPYGMKFMTGKRTSDKHEQNILQQMIKLKAESFNYTQIAKILNIKNFKTRTGKSWERWTVKTILDQH